MLSNCLREGNIAAVLSIKIAGFALPRQMNTAKISGYKLSLRSNATANRECSLRQTQYPMNCQRNNSNL